MSLRFGGLFTWSNTVSGDAGLFLLRPCMKCSPHIQQYSLGAQSLRPTAAIHFPFCVGWKTVEGNTVLFWVYTYSYSPRHNSSCGTRSCLLYTRFATQNGDRMYYVIVYYIIRVLLRTGQNGGYHSYGHLYLNRTQSQYSIFSECGY